MSCPIVNKKMFALCATLNEIISVNAISKFNLFTNDKLIDEQKKLRTELKVKLLVKNEQYLTEPFRYVNLINR